MSAKHTPEPWFSHPASGSHHSMGGYISNDSDRLSAAPICDIRGSHGMPHEANSSRIVACVNACAGIEDPAELRRQRDEMLEALKWAAEHLHRIYDSAEPGDDALLDCVDAAISNATKETK